jgi:ubiquinone/menaquinone biosynthesis methyltransferase
VTSPVRPERLFAPLGPTYERAGALLSLGLERGWRRRLIERAAPRTGDLYLDVATGTGLVARELRARSDCRVVGLDLTPGMLAAADRSDGIRFVQGRAEQLPFGDARFDGLTVTYLLRYVEDPAATMRELARVVRPGGRIAMLEFARPTSLLLRSGWWLYTRIALPILGALVSRDWRDVGAFLGGSIDRFYDGHDMDRLWRDAGLDHVRMEELGMGAAVVTSATRVASEAGDVEGGPRSRATGSGGGPARAAEREAEDAEARAGRPTPSARRGPPEATSPASEPVVRPAFYSLRQGGWRDYVTLLHPPYTLWHLSYVVLGAALASDVRLDRLAGTLIAFFLALGIGVHALDELNGRPLQTRIPDRVLLALAVAGLGGAVALGLAATPIVGAGLLVLIVAGIALALGYPLELARGRMHSDLWFALGWGAFPVLTAAYASGGSVTAAAVAGAAYAAALSHAQRRLSTWVRSLRRRAEHVSGEIRMRDGAAIALDRERLIDAPESGLRWLTAVAVLVALTALAVRLS